jgi:hypothetical protein
MKKGSVFTILILSVALILLSCGRWSDNIKLSTKTAEFSAKGDSLTVTTKGSGWWLSEITVDGKDFYDFNGIDIHADSFTVKQDCFTFERRDRHTLFIKLDPNPLDLKRIVVFELESGDYFDRVTITQKPK